jgi:outer membrane protein assembly factor BamB
MEQSLFPSDMPSLMPSTAPSGRPSPWPSSSPTIESLVNYYDKPELKWTTQVEGTGPNTLDPKLSKGNGVLASPDGLLVYVTTDNGSLQALAASNGTPKFYFVPDAIESGWTVSCNSGVYFGKTRDGQQYAVWAVIDIPPDTSIQDYSS